MTKPPQPTGPISLRPGLLFWLATKTAALPLGDQKDEKHPRASRRVAPPAPSERQEVAGHSSVVKVRTNETVLCTPDGTACISYRTLKSRNHGSSCMLRGTICRKLALSLPLPATGDFLLHLAGAGLGQGQNRDAVTQRARPRHPSAGDVCRGRHHAPDR